MYKVSIIDSSHEKDAFTCNHSQSLLDAALLQGIRIPYACKGGGCGMCKIKVEEGLFERGLSSKDVLPDTERTMNYSLACKTYPKGDIKLRIQTG
ncbi:2Fe-2S iron-sulfur cluster-binding protein [Ammoniphilus sp. 3BR4]|uniref:2Fe-2S iron-sulfur cluster-binding protein n=1 Tax=Ammoniphilus sp. 3BR4 TaxID=3158265 RepID=UPI0034668CD3